MRCERLNLDPEPLVYASRMAAKVDSAAVQDGYHLYHHAFFFTKGGHWCVVQQGMNGATRTARRYHWLSESLTSFVSEPHAAICSDNRGTTLNLVAREHASVREASVALATASPEQVLEVVRRSGPTLQALALVSEVIYGTPMSARDPARFAFAHGGKDGTPFPVDRETYDRTINVLHRAMASARVDRSEKLDALKRLGRFARVTEPGP